MSCGQYLIRPNCSAFMNISNLNNVIALVFGNFKKRLTFTQTVIRVTKRERFFFFCLLQFRVDFEINCTHKILVWNFRPKIRRDERWDAIILLLETRFERPMPKSYYTHLQVIITKCIFQMKIFTFFRCRWYITFFPAITF